MSAIIGDTLSRQSFPTRLIFVASLKLAGSHSRLNHEVGTNRAQEKTKQRSEKRSELVMAHLHISCRLGAGSQIDGPTRSELLDQLHYTR